ncbi:MAG: hypothetical protein JWQ26_536 [Modestobacter sp.]|jgi:uncharacterized membrane protein|nr:hypothetical protein [Modestobacter sp.]
MDPRSTRPRQPPARGEGSARLEALVPVPIGVAVAVTVALLHSPAVGLLLGWDTVAVLYIGWLAFVLFGRDAQQTARRATTTDPDRVATDVALLSAAVASLVTVAFVLIRAPHGSALEFVQVGFGVVSVVVSWAMVHTLFTLRYAALYYGRQGGGIDFNSAAPPTYRDFAYLAFTVGMTFQVSDTVLHSTALRRTVLRQALLSYLFGTGILATTVNLVASLRTG